MASRGVHCLLPGRKVAACADGPDVQNSSGWPCQWVFLSCPLHLLWPHSGWYIIAVVLGVPRAAGCPCYMWLLSWAACFVPRWRRGCLCRLLRAACDRGLPRFLPKRLTRPCSRTDNAERCVLIVDPRNSGAP